jgi:hypothetical protein
LVIHPAALDLPHERVNAPLLEQVRDDKFLLQRADSGIDEPLRLDDLVLNGGQSDLRIEMMGAHHRVRAGPPACLRPTPPAGQADVRGDMELESLIAVLSSTAALGTAARTLALWIRSRNPRRVVVRDGEEEVSLDLSNRREALRFLREIANSEREKR